MRAGNILLGCFLCVASIGAASAMEADGQDLSSQRNGDTTTSRDTNCANSSSGGDALGAHENCATTSPSSSPSNDNNGNGGSGQTRHNHRANLGWQSLLPGSIQ